MNLKVNLFFATLIIFYASVYSESKNYSDIQKEKMNEIIKIWQSYINTIDRWENLVKDIQPKHSGCGIIYELDSPFNPDEFGFAIADMRAMRFVEPS